MTHLGRASVAGALVSWGLLVTSVVFGGLDPSPTRAMHLQAVMLSALSLAAIAIGAAVVSLVRRREHVWATIGLVLALAFLILFTGIGFRAWDVDR
jgi:hypothetical protein